MVLDIEKIPKIFCVWFYYTWLLKEKISLLNYFVLGSNEQLSGLLTTRQLTWGTEV